MKTRPLGKSGLVVPAIGIGIAAWGFPLMGYGKTYGKEDLYAAYTACLDAGCNYFDTAESYAKGESERLLGEFRQKDGREIIIATKHKPTDDPRRLLTSLRESMRRLRTERIDLYQLHYPPAKERIDEFMDAMAEAVKSGLVRAVGVSNFNAERMKRAYDRLAHHGIALASNQVFYHLLERRAEANGVLALCRSLDVALIPFSPMAQGLLTGKFRNGGQKATLSQKVYFRLQQLDMFKEDVEKKSMLRKLLKTPEVVKIAKLEPLFQTMEEIASAHGATVPQVALNWLLAADPHVVPIPGAKNAKQALDNTGVLHFTLTREEYERICRTQERILNV